MAVFEGQLVMRTPDTTAIDPDRTCDNECPDLVFDAGAETRAAYQHMGWHDLDIKVGKKI